MDRIAPEQRAGWWRRSLALTVDGLCVAIPSALLGAALFALTSGVLQWDNPGLQWQRCEQVAIPPGLEPPPPRDSNAALLCESSSIAGTVGRELTVSRVTKHGTSTTSIGQSYIIPDSGEPGGHDVSWLTPIALLLLLIVGEWRTGSTPGKRLLDIRVVDAAAPDNRAVPLRRVLTRYAIAVGVYVALFGMALGFLAFAASQPDGPPPYSNAVILLLIIAVGLWSLWNVAMIVRRYPAVYDAYARVELIRSSTRPRSAVSVPSPGPA